jgi:hypothetical protein
LSTRNFPGRAGAFNLEAMRPRHLGSKAEVVEHRRQKHQLAVDLDALFPREELSKPVAAHHMVEEHVVGDRAREFLSVASDLAVWGFDIRSHIPLLHLR